MRIREGEPQWEGDHAGGGDQQVALAVVDLDLDGAPAQQRRVWPDGFDDAGGIADDGEVVERELVVAGGCHDTAVLLEPAMHVPAVVHGR